MNDTPVTDQSLAIGTLIGTMNGVVKTLEEQNKTNAENQRRIEATAAESRKEFMDVFKGMREDLKASNAIVQEHMKEDAAYHSAVVEITNWKKDAEPKVDTLWDGKNQQRGVLIATGTISSLIGGCVVAVIEYLKK